MARGRAVRRNELFARADEMLAQGNDVTALALLGVLGRGSLTTIYRHLDEWRRLHPDRSLVVAEAEISYAEHSSAGVSIDTKPGVSYSRLKAGARSRIDESDVLDRVQRNCQDNARHLQHLSQRIAKIEAEKSSALSSARELECRVERLQAQYDELSVMVFGSTSKAASFASNESTNQARDLFRLVMGKRQEILSIATKFGARKIRLFGSVARGDFDDSSDVDFLIDLDTSGLTGMRYFGVLEEFREELQKLLAVPVDVVDERSLNRDIRASVLRQAIVL